MLQANVPPHRVIPFPAFLATIVLLVFGFLQVEAFEQTNTPAIFLRGDVNGDRMLSQADIISLIKAFQDGRMPPCADAADFDDSGSLDTTDLINLVSFFYINGKYPEEPYRTPGKDPTSDDGLDCAVSDRGMLMVQTLTSDRENHLAMGGWSDVDEDDDGQVLDFIEFYNRRVAGFPGEQGVRIPILLSSRVEIDGLTLSLSSSDPKKVWLERIELPDSFPGNVHPELTPLYDERLMEGFLAQSIFMDFVSPFEGNKLPDCKKATVAYLIFSLSPEVAVGETYWIHFSDIPPREDLRPAPMNEICIGEWSIKSAVDIRGLEINIAPEDTLFTRGDVNRDYSLNITDVIVILRYLFATEILRCLDPADVDDSGMIDLSDVIYLADYIFDDGYPPAIPFPIPGVDLSPDSLGDC